MTTAGKLKVVARGEREIVMTRTFDAARPLVFDAFTNPDILKKWFHGPDHWTLAVCEIDLKVGGKYRYVWKHKESDTQMGMGGVYREIVRPERVVATEKFDDAWYPGEAVGTLVLVEQGGKTSITQTVEYQSREARDAVLASPMESGVAAAYDRLERMLPSLVESGR